MRSAMTPRTYEITFAGGAVPAIVGAFEDFDVIVGTTTTTFAPGSATRPPFTARSTG